MLSNNQIAILKQAAGEIAQPDYGDHRGMASDITQLVDAGLIQRVMEEDQPTAYATVAGIQLLSSLTPGADTHGQ